MSEQGVAVKTCLITVVEPGMPDKVIKVRPAQHESEKIWLDNRPGIERWAAVQQLMKRFCPRGKYVPDAAYWHTPGAKPEEMNILILKPEDIPLVELDGAVLEAPPPKALPTRAKPIDANKASDDRIEKLENKLDKLADAMVGLVSVIATNQKPAQQEVAPKRGRPKKTD